VRLILITDPRVDEDRTAEVVRAVERVFPRVIVQLRDKRAEDPHALESLLRVLRARTNAFLVMNTIRPGALPKIEVDGLHVPCMMQAIEAALRQHAFVSVPAHTDADVAIADRAGATAALVSPIFDVPGKGAARGVDALRSPAVKTRLYALGGITEPSRAAACIEAGAFGIAVIRALLDARDPEEVARSFRAVLPDGH